MFVSSYSTYLHTNTTDKTTKKEELKEPSLDKSFNPKDLTNQQNTAKSLTNTPINYVSNKALSTKAQIQQQDQQNTKNNSTEKYTSINSQIKASSAYASNSTMFSLMINYKTPIKQSNTTISQNLPQDIKDIKESFLKEKMVNTYIANDNYYKITA